MAPSRRLHSRGSLRFAGRKTRSMARRQIGRPADEWRRPRQRTEREERQVGASCTLLVWRPDPLYDAAVIAHHNSGTIEEERDACESPNRQQAQGELVRDLVDDAERNVLRLRVDVQVELVGEMAAGPRLLDL